MAGASAGADTTTRATPISFLTTRSALVSAAGTTIAVPCWSSWKTGCRVARAAASISKQRRGDVLQVDPARSRARSADGPHDLVGVLGVQADRPASISPNLLNSAALFSITGSQRSAGADVAEAEHGRAVGDDGDRVAPDREASYVVGFSAIAIDTRPTPGV